MGCGKCGALSEVRKPSNSIRWSSNSDYGNAVENSSVRSVHAYTICSVEANTIQQEVTQLLQIECVLWLFGWMITPTLLGKCPSPMAWKCSCRNVLGRPSFDEIGNISKPLELRKNLQCKSFQWYLDNVWPESELRKLPDDLPYMGPLRSVAGDMCLPRVSRGTSAPKLTSCTEKSPAFSLWR